MDFVGHGSKSHHCIVIHNFSVLNASKMLLHLPRHQWFGFALKWTVLTTGVTVPSELSWLPSPLVCVRVWVCAAVHVCGLPSIRSTFCPARVDLCLAAEQICQDCLVYIPKPERLHTWSQPSVKAQLTPGSTSGTKHQLTCPVVTSYDLLTTSTM